jgi:hypothetical protein
VRGAERAGVSLSHFPKQKKKIKVVGAIGRSAAARNIRR